MADETKEPAAETLGIPALHLPMAAAGTVEQRYGYQFTVQPDGTRLGEIPGYAVAGELACGRLKRPSDLAPMVVPAGSEPLAQDAGKPSGVPVASLDAVSDALGLTREQVESLGQLGIGTVQALSASDPESVSKAKGIGKARAATLIVRASEFLVVHGED